jgi:hypothetical protein
MTTLAFSSMSYHLNEKASDFPFRYYYMEQQGMVARPAS